MRAHRILRTAGYGCALFLFYIFNFLICHPVRHVITVDEPDEWTSFSNIKYGFTFDYPARWSRQFLGDGLEIKDPKGKGYVRVQTVPEKATLTSLPIDEYLIKTYPRDHAYLRTDFRLPGPAMSRDGQTGFSLLAPVSRDREVPWARFDGDSLARLAYMPVQFSGDRNVSCVEIMSPGESNAVFDRLTASFRRTFPVKTQKELLAQKLISLSEIPDPGVWYVGETRGFEIDINGDGHNELLIVGMRRTVEITEDKCFLRLLERTSAGDRVVLEKSYLFNSFHENDIRVINSDRSPGFDVFLRFFDYGNKWGQNGTVLIHFADGKYRLHEFGPFAEPRDVDQDGVDEILTCIRTHFNPGIAASWYDIYTYDGGKYVERNLQYRSYFRDALLPMYRESIADIRDEIMESKVRTFQIAAYGVLQRLEKYARWSEQIVAGETIP